MQKAHSREREVLGVACVCSWKAARIARLRAQGRSWPQITDELAVLLEPGMGGPTGMTNEQKATFR